MAAKGWWLLTLSRKDAIATLAQPVEQPIFNRSVAGSIPARRTIAASSSGPGRRDFTPETPVQTRVRLLRPVSSNGRTEVFGASYLGSNPSAGTE